MNTKIIALIAIAALGLLLVTAAMTTTNVFAGVITTVITTATIVGEQQPESAQSNACNGGSKCSNISSQQQGSGNRGRL